MGKVIGLTKEIVKQRKKAAAEKAKAAKTGNGKPAELPQEPSEDDTTSNE